MTKTKIEWATDVWNPTVGCTKVSAGCKNCYAERMFERFHPGQKFSIMHIFYGKWGDPLHWKKPRRVFVDSMSDLFHKAIPTDFIIKVWLTMEKASQHTFMILTKRPKRLYEFISNTSWGQHPLSNVWLGVTAEDQATADERIPLLFQTPAAVRFVSVEPMLGPVDLTWINYKDKTFNLDLANWVIVGCESGPAARPMQMDWVRNLRDQCVAAGVPFFLKQANIDGKLVKMPAIDGKIWDEIPEI